MLTFAFFFLDLVVCPSVASPSVTVCSSAAVAPVCVVPVVTAFDDPRLFRGFLGAGGLAIATEICRSCNTRASSGS